MCAFTIRLLAVAVRVAFVDFAVSRRRTFVRWLGIRRRNFSRGPITLPLFISPQKGRKRKRRRRYPGRRRDTTTFTRETTTSSRCARPVRERCAARLLPSSLVPLRGLSMGSIGTIFQLDGRTNLQSPLFRFSSAATRTGVPANRSGKETRNRSAADIMDRLG